MAKKNNEGSHYVVVEENLYDAVPDENPQPQPICKYCTEDYYMRQGRLGTTYRKIDAKYCPMCGRKLNEDDRKY